MQAFRRVVAVDTSHLRPLMVVNRFFHSPSRLRFPIPTSTSHTKQTDSVRSAGNNLNERSPATDVEKTIKSSTNQTSSSSNYSSSNPTKGSKVATDSYSQTGSSAGSMGLQGGASTGGKEKAKEADSSIPYETAGEKLSEKNSLNSASYSGGKATGKASVSRNDTWDKPKEMGAKPRNTVKRNYQTATEKLKDAADNASYKAGVAVGKAKTAAKDTSSNVKEAAAEVKTNYKAGKLVGGAEQKLKDWSSSSSSSSSSSGRPSSSYPGAADDTAQEIFDTAYDPSKTPEENERDKRNATMDGKGVLEGIVKSVRGAVNTAKEKTAAYTTKASEKFHDVKQSVGEKMEKKDGKSLGERIEAKMMEVAENMQASSERMVERDRQAREAEEAAQREVELKKEEEERKESDNSDTNRTVIIGANTHRNTAQERVEDARKHPPTQTPVM